MERKNAHLPSFHPLPRYVPPSHSPAAQLSSAALHWIVIMKHTRTEPPPSFHNPSKAVSLRANVNRKWMVEESGILGQKKDEEKDVHRVEWNWIPTDYIYSYNNNNNNNDTNNNNM